MDCRGQFVSPAGKWFWYTTTNYGRNAIPCGEASAIAGRLQAHYRANGFPNVIFRSKSGTAAPTDNPCGSGNPTPPRPPCTRLYYVYLTCPWGASGYLGGYRSEAEARYYGDLWGRAYGCRILGYTSTCT
jgi:hypothetical protein